MKLQSQTGAIGSTVKKGVVLAMLLVAVGMLTLYLVAQNSTQSARIINEGDQAPEFRLPSPDGRLASLSDYRGKVVMVHFWATWCPPCVEEIPTLERLYHALSGSEFVLIAVSVDEGGAEAVSSFMQRNKLSIPALLDPRRSVAKSYGTFKFPETYIVDRSGIVRYKAIGARDWSLPENVDILRDIIGRK